MRRGSKPGLYSPKPTAWTWAAVHIHTNLLKGLLLKAPSPSCSVLTKHLPEKNSTPLTGVRPRCQGSAVLLDCISLLRWQGTQKELSSQRLRGGYLLGNTSAPILGARASLEIWCTQSQPAQPQLVPGDYSAMGSDLLHTFPVGFLRSVSLQTNKKPGLQLTGLPAWKTLTIFPACLSLELLIPVSLGTNKCQRPATLRVVLNLKRMGCRMKKKKKLS